MAEAKRYRIKGDLKKIVGLVIEDHSRWLKESQDLCIKCGFDSCVQTTSGFASGKKLIGFAEPLEGTDLSKYRKPKNDGFYFPKSREGKDILNSIDGLNDWSLQTIWDYIGEEPHPLFGNMGIYQDKKLQDDETLFFSYNDNFKGHVDLEELKMSEYYKLIGE